MIIFLKTWQAIIMKISFLALLKETRCILPLILFEDMAIIISEVINMKEKECKQECNQKQNKNVEFAKEICNNVNKKNEKQNKEKQC